MRFPNSRRTDRAPSGELSDRANRVLRGVSRSRRIAPATGEKTRNPQAGLVRQRTTHFNGAILLHLVATRCVASTLTVLMALYANHIPPSIPLKRTALR